MKFFYYLLILGGLQFHVHAQVAFEVLVKNIQENTIEKEARDLFAKYIQDYIENPGIGNNLPFKTAEIIDISEDGKSLIFINYGEQKHIGQKIYIFDFSYFSACNFSRRDFFIFLKKIKNHEDIISEYIYKKLSLLTRDLLGKLDLTSDKLQKEVLKDLNEFLQDPNFYYYCLENVAAVKKLNITNKNSIIATNRLLLESIYPEINVRSRQCTCCNVRNYIAMAEIVETEDRLFRGKLLSEYTLEIPQIGDCALGNTLISLLIPQYKSGTAMRKRILHEIMIKKGLSLINFRDNHQIIYFMCKYHKTYSPGQMAEYFNNLFQIYGYHPFLVEYFTVYLSLQGYTETTNKCFTVLLKWSNDNYPIKYIESLMERQDEIERLYNF